VESRRVQAQAHQAHQSPPSAQALKHNPRGRDAGPRTPACRLLGGRSSHGSEVLTLRSQGELASNTRTEEGAQRPTRQSDQSEATELGYGWLAASRHRGLGDRVEWRSTWRGDARA
jgi:hypothetical protein